MTRHWTRRQFLRQAAVAGAAGTLAWPAPAVSQAPPSASSKLNLAFIGCGGRGSDNLAALAGENVAALCDPDENCLPMIPSGQSVAEMILDE